jgi:hypothetical protein
MKFCFEEWSGTRRKVKLEAEAQLRAIVAADTAFQQESAARGGVCTSVLSVVRCVRRRKNRARRHFSCTENAAR